MFAASPLATCRVCSQTFERRSTMHAVCSPKCALVEAKQKAAEARQDRVQTRQKLDALRPISHWIGEAQKAFNAYVRARDTHLPCISCGKFAADDAFTGGGYDAGHYLTTGARPELRFDESNCHRQCKPCNRQQHGNLVLYRVGLIARIGLERVERLEGPHPARKWTLDQLRAMARDYRTMARKLTKGYQPPVTAEVSSGNQQ